MSLGTKSQVQQYRNGYSYNFRQSCAYHPGQREKKIEGYIVKPDS